MQTRVRLGLGLAVFALGLAVRAVREPLVVTPGGVDFPLLGDLFYHARRIWFTAARFPDVLGFDPYVSFPDGAEIVWTHAYDWVIAAVARALTGAASQGAVESVAIWFPPVFGAATGGLVALSTARLYGLAAGAWAGGLFALLPVSFVFSQLGQLDHHYAVAFMATVALAATFALLRDATRARALGFGASLAALVGLWPGALVHVLILQVGMLVWMLGSAGPAQAGERARRLAEAHALAAVALAPFGLGQTWAAYGSWSPWVLSSFQPVWLAAAAVGLVVVGRVFEATALGATPGRRVAAVAGLAAAGVLAALAWVPELRDALGEASGWFRQAERFQEHVIELRPLLAPKGHFDLKPVVDEFGLPALLFPAAWLALALARRRDARAEDRMLLLFAAAFLGLSLNQRRFANTLAVPYAMVWGAVLGQLVPRAWARLAGRTVARAALAVATGAFVLVSTATLLVYYVPYLSQDAQVQRGLEPPRNPARTQQRLFERAGRFLAAETPPTRGYLDPSQTPEYGVLSDWGAGHLLRYRSERPMVQDNFGVYGGRRTYDLAWGYFAAEDEDAALEIARQLRVRYVVADPLGAGSLEPYPPESMTRRLAQNFGSQRDLPRGGGRIGALTRHRLVFHTSVSQQRTLVTPRRDPTVAVWEIVAGARVEGTAPAGEEVTASLTLTTREGRHHTWLASTRAGDDGRWRLVVPNATDVAPSSAVRVAERYRVTAGLQEGSFAVPDSAVRAGALVEGPAL
ncbi:MAG TPA: hypothetical protein VKB65_01640 [Myxococcota bacterium]|nr:hypothetical protein [Myxococcota bacterium]